MTPDIEKDEAAIKEWLDGYLSDVRQRDHEAYRKYYTKDIVMLPPNHSPIIGIESLVQMAKANFQRNRVEIDYKIEEIVIDHNIAFLRLHVFEDMVPLDGSEPVTDDRKTLFIFRRNSDDFWSASHVMWNSNLSK
jgi:ketosteroid isomerase-like protein